MTGTIVDIVTGQAVQPNQRTYGGVSMLSDATLTELVKGACFGARRHVQSAGWVTGQPWLIVLVDARRWIDEVMTRETVIGDRLVLAGHPRPERFMVICQPVPARAA